ncbi:lactonase family protein (plasmid) [Deinococcus sp. KNUC1210]|uniref:lactonase family protein n=1 Tax=Deinococcus sp. KNUC1210 TaxID=2917691 RepID=UPI001EF10A94|nr:lactonase family protein [Deinococcus sp. KNUC1210]ULH17761.1 lactonase family protein [Deinococcus sp. KNUC1210]
MNEAAATFFDVFVGSYTSPLPHAPHADGPGISRLRLDASTGGLSAPVLGANSVQPSFVALHPDGQTLYAVSERQHGELEAYRVQPDGILSPLGSQPTQGAFPAHVSVEPLGRYVLCVNYGSGVSVLAFPLGESGQMGPCAATAQHQGHGPDTLRQAGPHPHSVTASPDGRYVYVADLGTDEIVCYDLAPERLLHRLGQVRLPPGSGPRHLAFDAAGEWAFVSLELNAGVALLRRDPDTGEMQLLGTWPTSPPSSSGDIAPAAVLVSPDGDFVYVSNRGPDSVAVFHVNRSAQTLTLVQHVPAQGQTPRGAALSPDGAFLLVANQDSSSVTVFRRHPGDGTLESCGVFACPTPTCLCVLSR